MAISVTKLFEIQFFPVIAHRPGVPDSIPMKINVLADTAAEAIENCENEIEGFKLVSVLPLKIDVHLLGSLAAAAEPADEDDDMVAAGGTIADRSKVPAEKA